MKKFIRNHLSNRKFRGLWLLAISTPILATVHIFDRGTTHVEGNRSFVSVTDDLSERPDLFSSFEMMTPAGLPWDLYACHGDSLIVQRGIAAITCGATTSTAEADRYTFGLMSLIGALPTTNTREETTNADSVYHHPSWHVDSIGNVFGVTINTISNDILITSSSNYGSRFWRQEAVIRYGDIGGGDEDLAAAGAVYRVDPVTGQASLFTSLPQQVTTFTPRDCETGSLGTSRTTGVGLGNIAFDSLHNQYFITNIEDGRIYRVNFWGDILDSYDPFTYDDGTAGISILDELPYGIAVEPGSQRLFFGVIDSREGNNLAQTGAVGVYSIDLSAQGGFSGTIDNAYRPSGADYNNYVGIEQLHIDIATGSGTTFTDSTTYVLSDLSFTPDGYLLAGIRVSCYQTFFSSYNHYGETNRLTLNGGNNLYDSAIEYDISVTSSAGVDDNYGGVGYYQLADGFIQYVASSSDIIAEIGPHGIAIWPADSVNTPLSPLGALSYGLVNDDPKGAGGDIDVFNNCSPNLYADSNSPICEGGTLYLYNNIAADSVVWTGPAGYFSNLQSPSIETAPITVAGTYKVVLYNEVGVAYDSASISVSATAAGSSTITYDGCANDGYEISVNGTLYNELNQSGTEILLGGSTNGCDSTVLIDLTFKTVATEMITYDGCSGDGYEVTAGSSTYNELNPIGQDTIMGGATNGCDSIITTTLTFKPLATHSVTYDGCEGDGHSVTIGSTTYDEANPSGFDTIPGGGAAGCDSVIYTELTFHPLILDTILYIGCEMDGYSVLVGTNTYDEGTPFGTETLTSGAGCDSIVDVFLFFSPIPIGDENYNGCTGDGYEVTVGLSTYNELNTTGVDTLFGASVLGCDSIVTTDLTFHVPPVTDVTYTGCNGDGYEIMINSETYNEANPTGIEVFPAANGCDSTVNVVLIFDPNPITDVTYDGCAGDGYEIMVGTNTYNEGNTSGIDTLFGAAATGCDSIVTTTLTFHPMSSGSEVYDGCIGDGYEVTVGPNTYSESNPSGVDTLNNIQGCDSIVTTTLTFSSGGVCDFDLALRKTTVTTAPYFKGDSIEFLIRVFNQGGVDATDIELVDYVPTGLTIADNAWSVSVGKATLDAAITTLIPGDSIDISIWFTIDESFSGTTITNYAEIKAAIGGSDSDSTPDDNNWNTPGEQLSNAEDDQINEDGNLIGEDEDDHDLAQIMVSPDFDLALTKTTSETGPFLPGDTVTYTITVYNQGETDADSVTVKDYVPLEMSLVDADWSGETYLIGLVGSGSSAFVDVDLRIDPAFTGGLITNTAEISYAVGGTDEDSSPDDNGSTPPEVSTDDDIDDESPTAPGTSDNPMDEDDFDLATINVGSDFDLALITTVDSVGPYTAGDTVTFEITVYNQGTLAASDIVVRDYVPTGMMNIDANWPSDTYTISGLGSGGDTTMTIMLMIDGAFTGTLLTNNAEILSAVGGSDEDDALGSVDGSVDDTSEIATDNDIDDEAPGTPGLMDNAADVDDYDPAQITVGQDFDLALVMRVDSVGPYTAGDTVTFEITVYNQGTLAASDIVVRDYVPTGMMNIDANWPSDTYTISGLGSGGDTTMTIMLMIDGAFTGTLLTNNAEILSAVGGSDEDDALGSVDGSVDDTSEIATDNDIDDEAPGTPGLMDNAADVDDYDPAQITVGQDFDLALVMRVDSVGPYTAGDKVTFEITVYNQGTLPASDIVVRDYVPTGMMNVDANWPSDTYTISVLGSGEDTTMTIMLMIDGAFIGTLLTNNAEILSAVGGSDEDDALSSVDGSVDDTSEIATDNDIDDEAPSTPGLMDNAADVDDYDPAQITVGQDFDLALVTTVDSVGPYTAGDKVTFEITVYNQGTLPAEDIVIRDYVPTGMMNVDTNWPGDLSMIRRLGPGADTTMMIMLMIDGSFIGMSLVNNAEIISAAGGSDEDDDLSIVNGSADDTSELATDNDIDDEAPGTPGSLDNTADVDDYDPVQITVSQDFDLALITTVDSVGPYTAGDKVTFEITVYNQGTLAASDIVVRDYVPTGMMNIDINWPSDTYTISVLGSGEDTTMTMMLMIDGAFTGTLLTNNAEILSAVGGSDEDDALGSVDGSVDDISEIATDNDINDEAPGTPGLMDNAADVDDYDPAQITVGQDFDLALVMRVDSVGPYTAGDKVTFEITVYNQGTLPASDVVIRDYVPTGMMNVDANWPSDSYTIGGLGSGEDTTMSIMLMIDEAFTGTLLTNNAEIISGVGGSDEDDDLSVIDGIVDDTSELATDNDIDDEAPGTPGVEDNIEDVDDYDPAQIIIEQVYDLAIQKEVANSSDFFPGDTVRFGVVLENEGTVDAVGVRFLDEAPSELFYIGSDAGERANVTELSDLLFEVGELPIGTSEEVQLEFIIAESFFDSFLVNKVQITLDDGDDQDSDPDTDDSIDEDMDGNGDDDDEDSVEIFVSQVYDLAIEKSTISQGPYIPGDEVIFDITIVNEGTLPAADIYFEDISPGGLDFVGDNSSELSNVERLNGLIYIAESLEPGGSETVRLTFAIANDFTGQSLMNKTQIILDDGDDIDSSPESNDEVDEDNDGEGDDDDEDAEIIEVSLNYDLAIEKLSMQTEPVSHGDLFAYKVVVTNEGASLASNIIITDSPDPGLVYEGSDVNSNPNIQEIDQLVYRLESLSSGATDTIVLLFRLAEGYQDTVIVNKVAITEDDGDDIDSDPETDDTVDEDGDENGDDDDEDLAEVSVDQVFDLALLQRLSSDGPFGPGDSVTFSIVVFNQGTLHAKNIQLVDYIPEGLILSDSTWMGADSLATLTAGVDSLMAGDSVVVTITFTISPLFTGFQLTNEVEISGAEGGVDIDSNPDTTNDDMNGGDNVTDNQNGDEDDADPAMITILSCTPDPDPVFDPACGQLISNDILFIIDNSQSIDSAEYIQFENIIVSSIQKVQCECPLARVAVLHYGGAFGSETYLEYNFDNNGIGTVQRQFCTERNSSGNCNEGGDNLNEAVGDVVSYFQDSTLVRDPMNNLSIVIFTDAFGFEDTCTFVNCSVIRPFDNIDILKSTYEASVTVVGASMQAEESLLALYSSVGGSYNGALFQQDCDTTFDGCALPRKYVGVEFDDDPQAVSDSIFECISCKSIILSNLIIEATEDEEICYNLGETATVEVSILSGAPPFNYQWDNGLSNNPAHTVSPSTDVTYHVTVTDDNGCQAIDSVTIVSEMCDDCLADAGSPLGPIEECLANGIAILPLERNTGVVIPMGYDEVFLLTDSSLTIVDISVGSHNFRVDRPGAYRVHTLIADVDHPSSPDYLDLRIVDIGKSSIFVVGNCITDHGVCAALDFKGRYHKILGPEDMMCMTFENSIYLCWDGLDNDGDGLIDCLDEDCRSFVVCLENTLTACNDLVDNDKDGLVDCFDPDCFAFNICNERREKCDDGIDNDGDGLIDCADDSCNDDRACREDSPFTCADGRDNDGDGLIDCQETTCAGFLICAEYSVEACQDGLDNDQDGLVDCADADCMVIYAEVCQTSESNVTLCNDGIDNDADGLIDCADVDCETIWPCYITNAKSYTDIYIRVILEGAYDRDLGMMRTDLNRLGYLPGQVPTTLFGRKTPSQLAYQDAPWHYQDKNIDRQLKSASIDLYPEDVVDWLLVSFTVDKSSDAEVWKGAALLDAYGDVHIMTETPDLPLDDYYIIIEHRNHTLVMSKNKVPYGDRGWTYDFTIQGGMDSPSVEGLEDTNGLYMMRAGNGESILNLSSYLDINILDLNEWQLNNGQHSGYYLEDYDMNGDINVKDRTLWQKNNGKFGYLPIKE